MSILLFLLGCVDSCSKAPSGPTITPTGEKPDVVLVTLDTTRADRLGAYGYKQGRTDTIDAIAKEGIVFNWAFSPLPLTIPSHSTMFTGLFPFHHHVRANGDNVLAPEFVTLAERFQSAGYLTAASVAAFVTTRQWGFKQGFDAYFDTMPEDESNRNYWHTERSAEQVVDDALGWLAVQPPDKPVFLWIHVYDAHFPYQTHDGYSDLQNRPYDAELAYIDDQIARLKEAFADRRVLWSLIGDHGEALGEHHEVTHGLFTYNATQHIPWIVSGPGVTPGIVNEPVSSADLMPTLLRAAGIEIPPNLDGHPQPGGATNPYAESFQLTDRFRLAPHQTIVSGNYKLINTVRPELYDIYADPGEKTDLAASKPEEVARLQALLKEMNPVLPSGAKTQLDADTISQLAALGYVSETSVSGVDPFSLPDAKDFHEFIGRLCRLELMVLTKGPEVVVEELKALVPMKPDVFEVYMRQLPLLSKLGRQEEARAVLDAMVQQFPQRSRVWVMMASIAQGENQLQQALEYAERAIAADPNDPAAQEVMISTLFQLQRFEEGVPRALEVLKANPKSYGVAAILGSYYLGKREYELAERNLRLALEAPNPRRGARMELALMARAAGARQDAFKLLEEEIKEYPGNIRARRILATMYGEDQQWLVQKEHLAILARTLPKDSNLQLMFAQCHFNLGDYKTAREVLNIALKLAPEDPDVLLLHANLLAKEGKKDEGFVVFQKANALKQKEIDQRAAQPKSEQPKSEQPKSEKKK